MAIDDLLDEHEQGERVRDWLRQNGAGVIGGVILGLALIGGWRWWQNQRQEQRMLAGTQYNGAVEAANAGKLDQAKALVAALPGGVYATLGALELAKAQLAADKRDDAIATLRGVHGADAQLQAIVEQRLARLLIDAGKAADALKLLPANSTDPMVQQVRGDAFAAIDKDKQAQAAYQQALTRLEVGSPLRNVVEIKLSAVGGTPARPGTRS